MSSGSEYRHVLCRLDELAATGCREFRLGGGDWPLRGFVVQATDGVHAYVNRCAHLHLPLNYLPDQFLTHDGSALQCSVHGAIFRKLDGYCIAGPCSGLSLARVPIDVVDGAVLLAAGVDAAALATRYE
jgi:nitrite reductase/ring-hydroxylating ferredoxin subunit